MKAVLIVGAGALQVPMMIDAKNLGLAVIATDVNPGAPGAAVADQFFLIDTSDVQGHLLLGQMLADHHAWNLVGVTTCGSDSAPSVAAAARGAGVRGISLEIAQRCHDKLQVRCALDDAALTLYSPQWCYIHHDDSLEEVQQYIAIGPRYPCVVKPLRQRASRGVTLLAAQDSLDNALRKAWQFGENCLVEAQLSGTEHSAEIILGNNGETLWFNIVDRYFDYSSSIPIERGHVNPTSLGEHQQQQILLMVLAAARALGVTWGAFKVDCMMTADGPKILECTARLSGGWDCQWSSPATGRHPMTLLLQLACGLPLEPQGMISTAHGYAAVAAVIPEGILHNGERVHWSMFWDAEHEKAWALAEGGTAAQAARMLPPALLA